MATQSDVRRIALSLPGASEQPGRFAFSVRKGTKEKSFAWVWMERIAPKKPRVPNASVLAVRVTDLDEKDMRLAADRKKLFTEPHYDGFPAVLVRLPAIGSAELRELLTGAWRCLAPRDLMEDLEGGRTPVARKARRRRT